jgi:hypothetical protein
MTGHAASRSRTKLLSRVVLVLASLTLIIGVVEIALRIARYKPAISSAWILGSSRVVDADVVTIDPPFLRDDFYTPFQDVGQAKVVVTLGDSFTASFPVGMEDSYPRKLEEALTGRGLDARVMNVGLGDTGPDQQLKLFEKYVLPRVKPDIVVWQFYPNDTYENAIKAVYTMGDDRVLVPISATDNWMYRRQRFFHAIPLPASIKQSSYAFNLLLRQYERGLEAKVPAGTDKLVWGRLKIEREIVRMNELAAEHGFRVYYTLIAPQAVYHDDVPKGSPGANEAVEYDRLLPIVDREPTFIRGRFWSAMLDDRQLGATLFVDGIRDPSEYGTRHLNEAGYRHLAEGIANRILQDSGLHATAPEAGSQPQGPLQLRLGDQSSRRFLRRGWQQSESEGGHIWSSGQQSILDVPLPKGVDVSMDFECRPFEFPGAPRQTMSIVLNGKPIQRLTLNPDRSKYSVTLPASAFREWPDTIEINYGYAERPMDVITGSSDTRSLAVVWYSIDFMPIR